MMTCKGCGSFKIPSQIRLYTSSHEL